LEAASIEEVYLALAANCGPEQIVFDSPAKTTEEIRFCLDKDIHLNVNGFPELDRIAALYDTSIHHSTALAQNLVFRSTPNETRSSMPLAVLNGSMVYTYMLDRKASRSTNFASR